MLVDCALLSVGRMADAELTARCEALAVAKGGELIGPRRTAEGYDVVIIIPLGSDASTAEPDWVFAGHGNTADDAMRDLLHHHS